MPTAFRFAMTPRVRFGSGVFNDAAGIAKEYGTTCLAITGSQSARTAGLLQRLEKSATANGLKLLWATISGEPSPEAVDGIVSRFRDAPIDVVIGLGGGSVLDAAKAVAAMLTVAGSVMTYLEGVGSRTHPGSTLPVLALPTTAGTGSEATKNAVISRVGPDGFKKSLRHDNFIPAWALVDPELTLSCPPSLTAPCGLDALTQLLEAYVSTQASPMTDALTSDALARIATALVPAATGNGESESLRSELSYASFISGIALANAGLGVIHGLASPIGARIAVPHGIVCGKLLVPATRIIIEKLAKTSPQGIALRKYAAAARALTGTENEKDPAKACERLLETLEQWLTQLPLQGLAHYGMTEEMARIAATEAGNKNTPVALDEHEREKMVLAAL